MSGPCWEAAELGRLLYAHRLDPGLVTGALGLDAAAAQRLIAGQAQGAALSVDRREHAALLLNVLVRVELRCGHDPVAIAAAIERPLPELGGASIGSRLRAPVSLDELRSLRAAAGSMAVPKVKMWRVADRYS